MYMYMFYMHINNRSIIIHNENVYSTCTTCIRCLHGVIEDDHYAPSFLWPWPFFVFHFSLVQLNHHGALHKLCSSIIIIKEKLYVHTHTDTKHNIHHNMYMYTVHCTVAYAIASKIIV